MVVANKVQVLLFEMLYYGFLTSRWRMSSTGNQNFGCTTGFVILTKLVFCVFLAIRLNVCLCMVPPYYGIDRPSFDYELPSLEFGFSELEPYIDEETVRVHYLGHHSKYTEKMNGVLNEWRLKVKCL